ncbi:carboxyl-terminal processing protease CtpB [Chamaesiphon polymorphus]|uniref:Carboxyl-terminal-processing protease n=1 Tax=Chamaesiphon polymorphus CCALA 037 TaxID=2107692 RepID=A0A2T1GBN8_9CYAN|nr:carboxyl-terminal processing protease CtpB [Chamaesiphon polymorphus]PSB54740.1 peptidase S41 [Chamaesiphon polymorphus CCALA 037]
MTQPSTFRFVWQPKLVLRGAMFTGAMLATLLPIGATSSVAAFKDSPKAIVDEAWQLINREYVDGTFNRVDWQQTRKDLLKRNYRNRQEAYVAIRTTLKKLGDPYTRFMDPQQFQSLNNQTSGEMSGVGIKLEANPRTKQLVVAEAIENSPAAKAGIKAGDAIVAIDGKSTKNMTLENAIGLIRGEIGKSVTLKIARGSSSPFDVPLTRAQIEVASVFSEVKQEGKLKVGYIRLSEFSSHSSEQMQKAIKDLNRKQVNAYVLDMRGNPGGLLQASVEIARMWLDNGTIVKTVDRKGTNENFRAVQGALTQLPMAVLVDGNSASASEILAGALKDNRRAQIVGAQTFGKALVQSVHSLSDGSGIAVTVAHYYTPNGTDIGQKGVTPDVRVDLNFMEQKNLSESPNLLGSARDPQYQKAIAVLQSNPNLANPNPGKVPAVSSNR